MGCINSKSLEEKKVNKQIEEKLAAEEKEKRREVKLLLLGAGESGKSTVAKQLRIINKKPFTEQEVLGYRNIIYLNVLHCMSTIIKVMPTLDPPLSFSNSKSGDAAEKILHTVQQDEINSDHFPEELAQAITELWEDSGVRACCERRSEYQLQDSAEYFFENVQRYKEPDFLPTQEDIIKCRAKTSGIIETCFEHEGLVHKMFDLGGQRCERKKWLNCFEDVTAIIFCASLNDYDLTLLEDQSVNRMEDSLQLFESISNNRWFVKTSIILFLNKKDLFEDKIKKKPLSVCFPEFEDSKSCEEAKEFIKKKFVELAPKGKTIYTHFTCATDISNIEFVFLSVSDIILRNIFEQCHTA